MAGKRIDDLPLDDTPFDPAPDPRGDAWYRLSVEIDHLLCDGEHDWASDTLQGIQATVERTHQVTDAQRQAVDNIASGAERGRTSRRYEGWRR
jgi:hypothetical protein